MTTNEIIDFILADLSKSGTAKAIRPPVNSDFISYNVALSESLKHELIKPHNANFITYSLTNKGKTVVELGLGYDGYKHANGFVFIKKLLLRFKIIAIKKLTIETDWTMQDWAAFLTIVISSGTITYYLFVFIEWLIMPL